MYLSLKTFFKQKNKHKIKFLMIILFFNLALKGADFIIINDKKVKRKLSILKVFNKLMIILKKTV